MNTIEVDIRKATLSDFDFFYGIKSEYNNIYWTGHKMKPDYGKLKKWYTDILSNNKRITYIISYLGEKIGYLYLDIINKNLVEVAIAISEKYQRKGLASQSLKKFLKIIRDYNNPEIVAWIFDRNIASKKVFTKNYFSPTDETKIKTLPLDNTNEIMRKYIYLRNLKMDGDG